MNRNIKIAVPTIFINSGALGNLRVESTYALCETRYRVVRMEHSTTPQELFPKKYPKIARVRIIPFKLGVRVAGTTRKSLGAKAQPGTLLRSVSLPKYRVMMESAGKIHLSQHCIFEEETFTRKKRTRPIWPNKQILDECTENSSEEEEIFIEGGNGRMKYINKQLTSTHKQQKTDCSY